MSVALLAIVGVTLGGCQILLGIEDPVGDECSPFDIDTCDPTDTCDIDPDEGRLTCRAEGTVTAGELCFEVDDCAGPLSCVDGVCRTFCPVYGADCGSPEGECIKQWYGHNVCDSECDVTDGTGCIQDEECILSTNDNGAPIAVCVPIGYFGDLAAGEACEFISQCAAGFACSGEGGTCVAVCRLGDACANGPCEPHFETLHDEQIGLCPE